MFQLVEAIALGLLVMLALSGCSAIAPTYSKAADGAVDVSLGQYAIVDRLPADDQQAETSTVTGLSVRDMSIGVAQRDVLRNPVATSPLYSSGFGRVQDVNTATGDSLSSDYASGAAFEEAPDAGTAEADE